MSEVSDKISKVLEDPESLKMISQIAEGLLMDKDGKEKNLISPDEITDTAQNHTVNSEGNKDNGSIKIIKDLLESGNIDNSIMLISALKPYMSVRRSENAETVLRILRILKVLEKTNLSEISRLVNLIQ